VTARYFPVVEPELPPAPPVLLPLEPPAAPPGLPLLPGVVVVLPPGVVVVALPPGVVVVVLLPLGVVSVVVELLVLPVPAVLPVLPVLGEVLGAELLDGGVVVLPVLVEPALVSFLPQAPNASAATKVASNTEYFMSGPSHVSVISKFFTLFEQSGCLKNHD
jgi:hypothetical protein